MYVGDVSVASPVSWLLGDVELVVERGDAAGNQPARTAKLQPLSNEQTIIQHMFVSGTQSFTPQCTYRQT